MVPIPENEVEVRTMEGRAAAVLGNQTIVSRRLAIRDCLLDFIRVQDRRFVPEWPAEEDNSRTVVTKTFGGLIVTPDTLNSWQNDLDALTFVQEVN